MRAGGVSGRPREEPTRIFRGVFFQDVEFTGRKKSQLVLHHFAVNELGPHGAGTVTSKAWEEGTESRPGLPLNLTSGVSSTAGRRELLLKQHGSLPGNARCAHDCLRVKSQAGRHGSTCRGDPGTRADLAGPVSPAVVAACQVPCTLPCGFPEHTASSECDREPGRRTCAPVSCGHFRSQRHPEEQAVRTCRQQTPEPFGVGRARTRGQDADRQKPS